MPAPVLLVEHEPQCPPDRLAGWLTDAGHTVEVCRPYAGDPLPAARELHALVVLGGRMGAGDDAVAPWLPGVRQLLRDAVPARVPVLGVCLGAQLLAAACGGRVEVGAEGVEAGVVDVAWREEAAEDPLTAELPDPFPGPSMHHDAVVSLPPGAVWLGSSRQYPHQVFRVGARAWGVQFHPEASPRTFRGWAAGEPDGAPAAVAELERRDGEVALAGRALVERFASLAGP